MFFLQKLLADILSVLAMTMADPSSRESLNFKLVGSDEPLGSWGHEYIRNISGEIGIEYNERLEKEENVDDLTKLVDEIVPFNMKHNAEADACDLLMEVCLHAHNT
jgi:26S proteasome regulatory subunit N1